MKKITWNKLRGFESRDLIARYIKKRTGKTCSSKRATEISSNFIQGREYFRNADQASIVVKPLLLYYGVTALSRGLILANSNVSESTLKPSHGLSTVNWQKSLSDRNFEDLTVSITQGTFYELLSSTRNKSYLKHNSSGVTNADTSPIPPLDAKIRLSDLVQTFPDFEDEFFSWTEQTLNHLAVNSITSSATEIEYSVRKPRKNTDVLGAIFPDSCIKVKSQDDNTLKFTTDKSFLPHYSQSLIDPFNVGMGEIKLTKPASINVYLNTLGQYYVLSYFLGMLSRYFPSVWVSLGRTEKGDSIYPLFNKIIDVTYDLYPSLVLEYLNSPYPFEQKTE